MATQGRNGGAKTGGRQKGTSNKVNSDIEAIYARAMNTGLTPKEVMHVAMSMMYRKGVDNEDMAMLKEASSIAKDLAPYMHRKQPAEIIKTDITGESIEDYIRRIEIEKEEVLQ